jgi:hypothetical protein
VTDRPIVDAPDCKSALRPIEELPSLAMELSPAETGGLAAQSKRWGTLTSHRPVRKVIDCASGRRARSAHSF